MIGAHTGLPWPAIYHRRGGGGPTPDYVSLLDFMNGSYFAGGAAVLASAIVSSTAFIQAGIGLVFSGGTGQTIGIIGPTTDFLISGSFTAVFNIDATTDQNSLPLVVNTLDDNEEVFFFDSFTTLGKVAIDVGDYSDTVSRTISTPFDEGSPPGTLKVAVTRTNTRLSFSQNGADVVTDTTVYGTTPAAEEALIGGYSLNDETDNFVLRSITIYTAKDDAELPALSAL